MSKLGLIIRREFKSRVKKPSFLIFAFISPFLIAGLVVAPIMINKSNFTTTTIKIFDDTKIIGDILAKHNQNKFVKYEVQNSEIDLDETIEKNDANDEVMVLHIPENFIKNQAPVVELFNKNSPGIYIVSKVKSDLYDIRKKLIVYSTYKLDLQAVEKRMNSPVSVVFQGEGLNPQMKFFLGFAASLLLYFLIIMYGVQIMRGIMEEKSSRIIEIIVSSVDPKTLMNGKVIGVGLVGITQFFLIIGISFLILLGFQQLFQVDTGDLFLNQFQMMNENGEIAKHTEQTTIPLFNQQVQFYMSAIKGYLPSLLIITPILFFLGYYLYASFFAAIGSAMDHDTDTQQFVLPITIPLLLSGSIAYGVLQNPNSDLAFWSSLFPLSSPIVMTARLAFIDLSTDWWQVLLAVAILLITILFSLRFAARIYQTGILMYGQKVTYRTIWKWFKESK